MDEEKATSADEDVRRRLGLEWVVEELSRIRDFVQVARIGFGQSIGAVELTRCVPRIDKALNRPDTFSEPGSFDRALKEAARLEAFAKNESEAHFPFINSTATIRLWSVLESAIDDLVVGVLSEKPEVRTTESIQKLKGPLVQFAAAAHEEQSAYILDLLKDQVAARLKPGVGRFEAILEIVGLRGAVHESVRKVLLELSEVRHVTVHRRGIADKKLLTRCPWLELSVGDQVSIDNGMYWRYEMAVNCYVLEIDGRIDVMLNGQRDTLTNDFRIELEAKLFEAVAAENAPPTAITSERAPE